MIELVTLPLDRLLKLPCALNYQAGNVPGLAAAALLYGPIPPPVINRATMTLLSNPYQLMALATLKRRKYQAAQVEDWKIPTLLGDWKADDQARIALVLAGGFNGALLGDIATASLTDILLSYDTPDFEHVPALGIDLDFYQELLDAIAAGPEALHEPTPPLVPTPAAPTADAWDIPMLDPNMQGENTGQWLKWGTVSRTTPARERIYHFYTEDEKFSALANRPEALPRTGCKVATEINFSTGPRQPRALVLYDIYRKRSIARQWQEVGVRIFVDLCIHRDFFDLALLGVPSGWTAYANRDYADDHKQLFEAYDLAAAHAGGPITYCVYGGHTARDLCAQNNWQWINDDSDTVRGRNGTQTTTTHL